VGGGLLASFTDRSRPAVTDPARSRQCDAGLAQHPSLLKFFRGKREPEKSTVFAMDERPNTP